MNCPCGSPQEAVSLFFYPDFSGFGKRDGGGSQAGFHDRRPSILYFKSCPERTNPRGPQAFEVRLQGTCTRVVEVLPIRTSLSTPPDHLPVVEIDGVFQGLQIHIKRIRVLYLDAKAKMDVG